MPGCKKWSISKICFCWFDVHAKYRFSEGLLRNIVGKGLSDLKAECLEQNFKVKDRTLHRRERTSDCVQRSRIRNFFKYRFFTKCGSVPHTDLQWFASARFLFFTL